MSINYNVNPYYDDYDETKQFYRLLFRPGRAVQARELTQIQTNLQKQIERFGRGIYKEGSIVVPGGIAVDRYYNYVKLTDGFGSNVSDTLISSLVNSTITGSNSKVTAIVVNAVTSTTDGDPPTLYVRYTSSNTFATGSNTTFQASDVITNSTGNITLQVANSAATGFGTSVSVTNGVVFTKGVFAYFDDQTYIAEKYAQANNTILGFEVTESTVTSTDDTSLLDPAVGASNYIAPGSDRYKIALDLSKRSLTVDASEDPDFIELVRIEDGEIISNNLDPQYSILGATLARRTFDESGNYIVKPYDINIINHLRSSNSVFDGYFLSSDGGDDDKFVAIVQPGKAYIQGYEIQNIRSKYIEGDKARDYANVNNGIISTTIGNYIYITNLHSSVDVSTLSTISLYDEYNTTPGTANGNLIGTAKIRGLEYYSGTAGTDSAVYRAWLFDVSMAAGYVFERDVKQIFSDNSGFDDFTANIEPTLTVLTGSVITTNGSSTITGAATRFDTELTVGDYITVGTQTFRVGNVVNSTSITANSNATTNATGVFARLNTVVYNDTEHLPQLFELPYSVIRTVDPTNLETSYDVKRSYSRTLSSNAVTITAGTDEVFASVSTTNYTIFITSGTHAGNTVSPTGLITRGGSPTGKNITLDLTSLGAGYATADIVVITTIQKSNSAADKKTKTLVTNATVDYSNANTAQASTISLGKADIYRVVSVSMSNAAFDSAYTSSGAIDITSRYTVDNGQRLTYYGVGSISLKPNQPKPTGPIRITFDYFTHGTGDYFSVDSYADIDYEDIPSFNSGNKIYQLRDCLDFRPRINDAGTGFSGTGAVVNDFLSPSSDVQTDYSYYLPRTDLIVLDREGLFRVVKGVSSLNPVTPKSPDDVLTLYILQQNAYVFDVKEDISVTKIDNRRYTMRDIGKIETRVKNLEYYTLLNLLERETESLQIQDSDGFDRFKNGFIVDNFTGHSVGDVFNRDYGVSIDSDRRELRPITQQTALKLREINGTTAARTANNYVISETGVITLPYTNTVYVRNQKASTTENINPFGIITWLGTVRLDPSDDKWFETEKLPAVSRNEQGNYDHLRADAQAKGLFNMNWGDWRGIGGNTFERSGTTYEIVEQIDKRIENDVLVNTAVIPRMRDIKINFIGEGLKPNTRMRVFFDNINVTNYCQLTNAVATSTNTQFNAINSLVNVSRKINANNIITDSNGKITGTFTYISDALNLPTGEKSFRLTDSPINDSNFETLAETVFTSSGETRFIRDEFISVRNGTLNIVTITQQEEREPDPPPPPDPPAQPSKDFVDLTYNYLFGRAADASGKSYWVNELTAAARERGFSSIEDAVQQATVTSGAALTAEGGVNPGAIPNGPAVGANDAAVFVFEMVNWIGGGAKGIDLNPPAGPGDSLLGEHVANGADRATAIDLSARQIAYGVAAYNSGLTTNQDWVADVAEAVSTPVNASNNVVPSTGSLKCVGKYAKDPLAQSFFVDQPLFLTKVGLFFSAKDETGIPMRIELRKMVNGTPGEFVVPLSEVAVYPDEITVSDDASEETEVSFRSPVYLDPGEYALVLLADSISYRVWISQVGQTDVATDSLISEQPYIGVLFKSQNASTWSPDQFQDLKFTLYRADFSTSVTGTIDFTVRDDEYDKVQPQVDPLEIYPNSTVARIYSPRHGQSSGSFVRITGWPAANSLGVSDYANSNIYNVTISSVHNVPFAISNTTIDSFLITLPSATDANVPANIVRTAAGLTITRDIQYDTYFPIIPSLATSGTTITNKIKTVADSTYVVDSDFTTISVGEYDFETPRVLASNVNKQLLMSNSNTFIHQVEISTINGYLSPVIDTQSATGLFVRNVINNPTYSNQTMLTANDVITIANANNITITQTAGVNGRGVITFTTATDKTNAAGILKGTYLNITSNNNVNAGQYRVIDITDSGANVAIYNLSGVNVSTNSTSTYTITSGRNFIAEEAAFDGSAYSKYITRQVDFVNPCTAFKFYLDANVPSDASLKFYYKISEVGDTVDLKDKEYTEVTGVTLPTSLDRVTFDEVEKIVENLPQFDAIVFKIVFLSDSSSQIPKVKNLRIIALA